MEKRKNNVKTDGKTVGDNEKIDLAAKEIMEKYRKAFEELAK